MTEHAQKRKVNEGRATPRAAVRSGACLAAAAFAIAVGGSAAEASLARAPGASPTASARHEARASSHRRKKKKAKHAAKKPTPTSAAAKEATDPTSPAGAEDEREDTAADDAEQPERSRAETAERPAPAAKAASRGRSARAASAEAEGDVSADGEGAADEDADDQPSHAEALIGPRLANVAVGATAVARSFSFDAPLQRESSFPRPGIAMEAQVLPLRPFVAGALRNLGLGLVYAKETGKAVLSGGAQEQRLSVVQDRFQLDARWAFALSPSLTLTPLIGYGRMRYQAVDAVEALPSQCPASNGVICLPRVILDHAHVGADLGWAITESVALLASAGALVSVKQDAGSGALAAEANVRTLGFTGRLGGVWALRDWFGVRATVDLASIHHMFSSPRQLGYSSATETYWSFGLGVVGAFGS